MTTETPLVCTSTDKIEDHINSLFRGRNRLLASALLGIFGDMRQWWPLTVRQAFYQCVSRQVLSNTKAEYRRVSTALTELRREDLLPWHAVIDRTRTTVDKRGEPDIRAWLREQWRLVFDPSRYGRCYIQNQPVYVEVCVEKDALAGIAEEAVWPYCTRLNVTRGHPSASMQNAIAERMDKAIMLGKRPIILHFGDLDPSGIAIPRHLQNKLAKHHGLDVEVRRVALHPAQVEALRLPPSLDEAKQSDPNYAAWVREYGPDRMPVELDAIHPEALQRLIAEALEGIYDMSEFEAQKAQEQRDRTEIRRIRHGVQDYLAAQFPRHFGEVAG